MASTTTPTAQATTATEQTARTERMGYTVVAVTGVRCLLMYVILPAAGIIGNQLTGIPMPGAGIIAQQYSTPVLSLSLFLHAVTLVTTVIAVRRAFRNDYRWKWPYAALGSTFFLFSALSILIEGAFLLS